MKTKINRRRFISDTAAISAASVLAGPSFVSSIGSPSRAIIPGEIFIDPRPVFEVSPLMYMQFMEPLGATEPSVEGSWDYRRNDWREDFIECVSDLAPDMIRWGGILNRYYKWREGIGPAGKRPWMILSP